MVDTIVVAFLLEKNFDVLAIGPPAWRPLYSMGSGDIEALIFKPYGKQNFYLKIQTYKEQLYLVAQGSLASLLLGENARQLTWPEIEIALSKLEIYINTATGNEFDIKSAAVWRIDFVNDRKIGENKMSDAYENLRKMDLPYFDDPDNYKKTIKFRSGNNRNLVFYPKMPDCIDKGFSAEGIRHSMGILRSEIRFLKPGAVRQLCKNQNLIGATVRNTITKLSRNTAFKKINPIVDRVLSIGNNIEKIAVLTNHFKPRRTQTLLAFLVVMDTYGKSFFKDEASLFCRSAYYRNLSDLRKVGVFTLSN